MTVFILEHCYEYGEELEHENRKILGVYSSSKNANTAKENYFKLPGFKNYSLENFDIYEVEVDTYYGWEEGFVSTKEAIEYQEKHCLSKESE